jgi:hypothetical protein
LHQIEVIENDIGITGTSGSRFVQDASLIGSRLALWNGVGGPDQFARPVWPNSPLTYIRAVFDGNGTDVIRKINNGCDQTSSDSIWPIARRQCDAGYVWLLQPTFQNSSSPFTFSGEFAQGNRNSYWRVDDAQGLPSNLPNDFLIMRKDQQDPNQQTNLDRQLLTGTKTWNDAMKGLVVSTSSLPNTLVLPIEGHTGKTGNVQQQAAGIIPAGQ